MSILAIWLHILSSQILLELCRHRPEYDFLKILIFQKSGSSQLSYLTEIIFKDNCIFVVLSNFGCLGSIILVDHCFDIITGCLEFSQIFNQWVSIGIIPQIFRYWSHHSLTKLQIPFRMSFLYYLQSPANIVSTVNRSKPLIEICR